MICVALAIGISLNRGAKTSCNWISLSIFVETVCSKSTLETPTPDMALTAFSVLFPSSVSQPLPVARPMTHASLMSDS